MGKKTLSFRVGRVRAHLRDKVWYLSYWEQGRRRQPRVGPDRDAARVMAAEINGQLEAGAPSALGFEAIGFAALRDRWLAHHEHVRRSSLNTIGRYRTAIALAPLGTLVNSGEVPEALWLSDHCRDHV